MAATLHAKLNRRKLDKLDIIKICFLRDRSEEILNPSVPMALRLSGILMGGVVIVYERKVKLLYGSSSSGHIDPPAEINGTWKTKTVADPTVLPKAKAQAKFEAVTLPECVDMDVEQSMLLSDASVAASRFQRMRLDEVEEHYINIDIRNGDPPDTYHQVDAENITLFDDFGSGPPEGDCDQTDHDFVGEDETQINYTPQEQPHFHNPLRPSPPVDDGPKSSMPHQLNTSDANHRMNVEEPKEKGEGIQQQQQVKQNARRKRTHLILDEQLMIPGNHYQSWLQDTSDIVSKRGRTCHNPIRSTKISKLMNLPPVALITGLEMFPSRVHFPAPLIELWRNSTILGDKSPAEERHEAHESAEIPLNPEFQAEVPPNNEFQAEIQPNPLEFSIEKVRANLENLEFQGIDKSFSSDHFATPGSQGQSSKSIPSSGSGHFMPLEPEIQLHSGRSKRKQNSSSTTNFGNLDPVEEESPLQQDLRSFKLRRISQLSPAPDAGAPQSESLNQLALGMNKKTAALLFYQTCVLATFDFIKVEQHVAYGDILISRGPKM
ncbi:hypothetical protein ZIOFF_033327 [Zingiber officinale]|uniref:Sister chromatid cohesion 1 protein 1 n=1 Tax=Zingiber officinale TaxID=94328 RepID=A0A8J5GJN9_ZINOF|nr:hypothetical protein ZIOFF_033327 [Zingiber officinale]